MKTPLVLLLFIFIGCLTKTKNDSHTIFKKLSSKHTKIKFSNTITETDSLNYFTYTSIYNGAGVSVGDINNDGLLDLFFTANQTANKLYLNTGNLEFLDITETANITGDNRWYTGATMVDINNDGFLDIYCSVGGKNGEKHNQLFINNQNNTFTEQAERYGLSDAGNSTQATFFDYDNDGDLDMYLANYPISHPSTPNMIYKQRMKTVSSKESDKLYRNDGETFTDVSEQAGVKNYSFSFGIAVADLNNDGWKDIYVSNDYSIPDFLYLNNQDGTFKECIKEATSQTSFYGMGIDIADINNDGFLDIFQADMDSDNNRRQKANMTSMNPSFFNETVLYGFHYQYMHNCLQLHSGYTENGIPKFSNVSRLTGTSSTDWSWAPLFADFDNNGYSDLFVTNGTRREINNKDFFNNLDNSHFKTQSLLEKNKQIPSEKIDNFMFKNMGNLKFEKVNSNWGVTHKGFSNAAAYADLDNDGDLELIISNIDEEAVVYENHSSKTSNYLNIKFKGTQQNIFGIGNRVYLFSNGKQQLQELTLTRGFQSSVAPELHFGLGEKNTIDSLKVVWFDGKTQYLKQTKTNQSLVFNYNDAIRNTNSEKPEPFLFTTDSTLSKNIKHHENIYDDFDHQVLLPHKLSTLGPAIAVSDINNDGLEDLFIGGSYGKSAEIHLQKNRHFVKQVDTIFNNDNLSEDTGALFFDADNDGDKDLYVVSGGYEFALKSKYLHDRLYVNNGNGNFTKQQNAIPEIPISGSKAYEFDYNNDGKQDLLVLGRQLPGNYPLPSSSYILKNMTEQNNIAFKNVSDTIAPKLNNIGMGTSAVITDFNNDGWQDIIIVGEWMPIKVFKNQKGSFVDVSEALGLADTTGWWWSIQQGDFDNDGDTDYIVGNNGLNYKYKATENETFDIYAKDFDKNLKHDIVLGYYNNGKQYPVRGKQCSSQQIPSIKQKFKSYNDFSKATLNDVYGKQNLDKALHYKVKSFASVYIQNKQDQFRIQVLPIEAQLSSIQQILVDDFDHDNQLDAIIAGNLYNSEVETPRNDAGYGLLLKGNGKGDFFSIPVTKSGLYTPGNVKDLLFININNEPYIISAKNNAYLQFIKRNHNLNY